MVNRANFYYDFHYPLPFVELILELLGRGSDPSTPVTDTGVREWFSQPREGRDGTVECLTVNFRLPVSVSEFSAEVLRMPCTVEAWYQDRSNNWRPILDMQRSPLRLRVSLSDTKSWYNWSAKCYPIVAKKVQFRIARERDPITLDVAYPVGMRNTLIRRNVYDRHDGGQFEDENDVMGNLVSKHIRDWDAPLAIDDNYTTYWKSAPQPDPAAVVSLYLDVRDADGNAQTIDKLYIDPVYANQHLNIYYTSDETSGTRVLSPITLPPPDFIPADSGVVSSSTPTSITDDDKDWTPDQWVGHELHTGGRTIAITGNDATTLTFATVGQNPRTEDAYQIGEPAVLNTSWRRGRGLVADADADSSLYSWSMAVGPQNRQPGWIGVEWRPDFDSANADLATNPVLFAAGAPKASDGAGATPRLYYEPENRTFNLVFEGWDADGGNRKVVAGPFQTEGISEEWLARDGLRIVAGWGYGADGGSSVTIRVVDSRARAIASLDEASAGLPDLLTLDGVATVRDFKGAIANLVVKLEDPATSSSDFIDNPTWYCDPDPVIPDDQGRFPSTSLDNAIYAAPFTSREHGSGGADKSAFEDKEWTPVWRDYVVRKGMLWLPRATSMKYLKLEFTNLSEEPYPIYESGIEVKYKVFPVQVTQTSSIGPRLYTGGAGFLGMGTFISMNGVRSVNWLDPNSVLQAIGSVIGPQTPPVVVNVGKPYITESLPNQGAQAVEQSRRIEAASAYVYPRDTLQPYVLASDQYNTIIKADGLQAVQPYVDVPWAEIEAANPGAVTKVKEVGTVPVRGTDWWIYPGQQLKVPASVMKKLTDTQTVTERKLTLESRLRFNTTQVHRYEYRTVKRDAAVAYFAGVREVQPYTSSYIKGEDKPVMDFPVYDPKVWDLRDATVLDDGTVIATHPNVPAVISSEFKTQSDFSLIKLKFNDTGLAKSDSMWADPKTQPQFVESGNVIESTAGSLTDGTKKWGVNQWVDYYVFTSDGVSGTITANDATTLEFEQPGAGGVEPHAPIPGTVFWISKTDEYNRNWLTGNVIDDDTALAPYVDTVPSKIPAGTWSDFSAAWKDVATVWGSPFGLVNITLDPDRRFMGHRVVHFTREGGTEGMSGSTGRAGISVDQWNGFTPGAQARIGCIVYRPAATNNRMVLTLRRADGVRIHEEKLDAVPTNRWYEYTTNFFDVPETLEYAGFENGFQGWITTGAPWSVETAPGRTRTGGKCARLATSSAIASGLSSVMVKCTKDTTVKASAWLRWQGLATNATGPVMYLRAVFYDNDEEEVASFDLDQNSVTPRSASQGWTPVSGGVVVPRGVGAAWVSFELVVEETAGGGGTVWVDDFSVDVPFAPRQQYQVQLTLEGDKREELYVSDLYTEITPVRYYVQLGRRPGTILDDQPVVWDADPVEVTDLRYTKNTANVTRTVPANAFRVVAVINSNHARAIGARIVPNYLK